MTTRTDAGQTADTTDGGADLDALQASFDKAQETQIAITIMTADHQSKMKAYEAQKKAYEQLKA